jgi:hypothetical protein
MTYALNNRTAIAIFFGAFVAHAVAFAFVLA